MSVRIFRKGAGPYAFAEAMTGVRLGERLLYVGAGDPGLFAALAAKAGLTGRARAVVESEAAAERIRQAAARAGVLVEVGVGSPQELPAEEAAFDVAIIDASGGLVLALSADDRVALGRAVLGTLRPRGRAIVAERLPHGLRGLFTGRPAGLDAFRAEGGAERLLGSAGFGPVRLLADENSERYTEGWKAAANG